MPHRPVMLGVVGDSAAGKTTISAGIAQLIGSEITTVVCVDDYHRYNREQRKQLGITALHPDCNYIDIMEQHIAALADGKPILKPVYNHKKGDFDPPVYVKPTRFVIIEGLLAFHTQALRDAFAVKVYLDPPEEVRRVWKVNRDCAKRGYTEAEVLAELELREGDSAAYIRPQRRWADLVVRFFPPAARTVAEHLAVQLTLRATLPQPDVSDIIARSGIGAPAMHLAVGRDNGRLAEFLEIDGQVTTEQAQAIEAAVWAQRPEIRHLVPEQIGAFAVGREERRSKPLALTQLFIAYHLLVGRLAKDEALRHLQAEQLRLAQQLEASTTTIPPEIATPARERETIS